MNRGQLLPVAFGSLHLKIPENSAGGWQLSLPFYPTRPKRSDGWKKKYTNKNRSSWMINNELIFVKLKFIICNNNMMFL